MEYVEDYNPYYSHRNSVEPDSDALSNDEDAVKRRELLELEEAILFLRSDMTGSSALSEMLVVQFGGCGIVNQSALLGEHDLFVVMFSSH